MNFTHSRVLTFALLIAIAFPSVAVWMYFIAFSHSQWMVPVFGASKIFQFLFPAAWAWFLEGWRPRRINWSTHHGKGLFPGLLLGILGAGAIFGLYSWLLSQGDLLSQARPLLFTKLEGMGVTTTSAFLGLAVFYVVIHSFMEEYYWRWFVFGRSRQVIPTTWANILSSLGFMAHHVILLALYVPVGREILILPFSLAVAIAGSVWARLYEKSGTLIGPWLSHACVDAALMYLGYQIALG